MLLRLQAVNFYVITKRIFRSLQALSPDHHISTYEQMASPAEAFFVYSLRSRRNALSIFWSKCIFFYALLMPWFIKLKYRSCFLLNKIRVTRISAKKYPFFFNKCPPVKIMALY